MKAAIYNPYLDSLGGGERYTISFAQALSKLGYEIKCQWADESIRTKIEDRFGFKIPYIHFVRDIKRGDGYDICFWISDGSIPVLKARKNLLHFQIPFNKVGGRSLMNKMKLFRINKVVCNSYFTKKFIDTEFGVDSVVIYPPVDVERIKQKRKENLIIYAGRFSQLTQAKNQHILIEIFKRFYDSGYRNWKLILAGGTEVGSTEYIKKIKKMGESYPVSVVEKPSYKDLLELYAKAKIFWSAAGFGVNEKKEPGKVEHFGITLVEAMSARCIPFVYNAGGYKEIVQDAKSGFLWDKKSDLLRKTRLVIKDPILSKKISKNARKSSLKYSYQNFEKEVHALLD